ncbi:hypothetical protein DM860_001194 [Cuscuta australis]|uniref:PHD-type domain-containing protein n=1 Tax=Cuscuta australis TaxID=267555 RepID=A0A328DT97_9ASTE|nr:hypothetical protein DM860_001194 [Cuscuta australis]
MLPNATPPEARNKTTSTKHWKNVISSRKICHCSLGFSGGLWSGKRKDEFLQDVAMVEEFLKDPWLVRARENATIQVRVPRLAVAQPSQQLLAGDSGGGRDAEEAAAEMSAQTKRVSLQKKAAAASSVAEDFARRFESGNLVDSPNDTAGEEPGQSNAKVMCRLCFRGEWAKKTLPCKMCGKKYHRSCLKTWAQHRDLFHWSSWTCPSCRSCEVNFVHASFFRKGIYTPQVFSDTQIMLDVLYMGLLRSFCHSSASGMTGCHRPTAQIGAIRGQTANGAFMQSSIAKRSTFKLQHILKTAQQEIKTKWHAGKLEIQISSCFAKDVMQRIIATAYILRTGWCLLVESLFLHFVQSLTKKLSFFIIYLVQNVSNGTYLCPKHTKCHSCNSSVPGNGQSVRWFLEYTCCDACGRLFTKGNYCPVCLKVYRDSESTPMVCCDICQRWVHCHCDGISDEKYLQFQVDGNLQYACPTCRGDCYQVRNQEEAIQELWRRKDEADKEVIASLRAAAGLPTQEEIFSISPFSDDDDSPIVSKNEFCRSLKFSLKGLAEKSPMKSKDYGKKSSNKKYGKNKGHKVSSAGQIESHMDFQGQHSDAPSGGCSAGDVNNDEMKAYRGEEPDSSPIAGSLTEGICFTNQAGVVKSEYIDMVAANNGNKTSIQIKGSKHQSTSDEDVGAHKSMSKTTKGPKLVIHLGTWNKFVSGSPKSDVSSCQRDQYLPTSNGGDDMGQKNLNEHTERNEIAAAGGKDHLNQTQGQKIGGKEGPLIKIKKPRTEIIDRTTVKTGQKSTDGSSVGKRSNEASMAAARAATQLPASRSNKVSSMRQAGGEPDGLHVGDGNNALTHSMQKDPKRPLKLKFKNPYPDVQNQWASTEEEKGVIKGQRSKRKRPSLFGENSSATADLRRYGDNSLDEMMDANWILQKLGKDAVGKRVEVHYQSDNTWHRGKVTEFFEGTSIVAVTLDDGDTQNVELGKQGIRGGSKKKEDATQEDSRFQGVSRQTNKLKTVNLCSNESRRCGHPFEHSHTMCFPVNPTFLDIWASNPCREGVNSDPKQREDGGKQDRPDDNDGGGTVLAPHETFEERVEVNDHPEGKEQFPEERSPRLVAAVDGVRDPRNDTNQIYDEESRGGYEKGCPLEHVQLRKVSVLIGRLGGDREVGVDSSEHFEQSLDHREQVGRNTADDPKLFISPPLVNSNAAPPHLEYTSGEDG